MIHDAKYLDKQLYAEHLHTFTAKGLFACKRARPDIHTATFGVQIPTSISHTLRLDKTNGNNLWKEAIDKEMAQLKDYKTFRKPTDKDDLSTYQQIPYHMVFDCKFDGRRKGRLVAGGNHTIVTSEQVYSGVVGIETVRWIRISKFVLLTSRMLSCMARI
jgi:hypothetical protein